MGSQLRTCISESMWTGRTSDTAICFTLTVTMFSLGEEHRLHQSWAICFMLFLYLLATFHVSTHTFRTYKNSLIGFCSIRRTVVVYWLAVQCYLARISSTTTSIYATVWDMTIIACETTWAYTKCLTRIKITAVLYWLYKIPKYLLVCNSCRAKMLPLFVLYLATDSYYY